MCVYVCISSKRGVRNTHTHTCSYKALADLFLDTFAFNGHGTLAQMLWMAVPVGERVFMNVCMYVLAQMLWMVVCTYVSTCVGTDALCMSVPVSESVCMCMYVCILCVHMFCVYVCVGTDALCMSVPVAERMCVYVCVCMYVCILCVYICAVCMYVFYMCTYVLYVCIYFICVHMYCMSVCMCCMHVYIYIYIFSLYRTDAS
jgi:hypothetical protein